MSVMKLESCSPQDDGAQPQPAKRIVNGDVSRVSTRRLPAADENDLIWFFGPGQTLFLRSPFGAMLDRQRLYASRSVHCVRCEGSGFQRAPWRVERSAINGQQPREGDDLPCRNCSGMGWIVKPLASPRDLSVMLKPAKRIEPASFPEEVQLARYVSISRVLGRLAERHSPSVRVLSAYCGDIGSRWARTRRGRVAALYPLTEAGAALRQRLGLAAENWILGEGRTSGDHKEVRKSRNLLRTIDDEARALYANATTHWRQAKGERAGDEPTQRTA